MTQPIPNHIPAGLGGLSAGGVFAGAAAQGEAALDPLAFIFALGDALLQVEGEAMPNPGGPPAGGGAPSAETPKSLEIARADAEFEFVLETGAAAAPDSTASREPAIVLGVPLAPDSDSLGANEADPAALGTIEVEIEAELDEFVELDGSIEIDPQSPDRRIAPFVDSATDETPAIDPADASELEALTARVETAPSRPAAGTLATEPEVTIEATAPVTETTGIESPAAAPADSISNLVSQYLPTGANVPTVDSIARDNEAKPAPRGGAAKSVALPAPEATIPATAAKPLNTKTEQPAVPATPLDSEMTRESPGLKIRAFPQPPGGALEPVTGETARKNPQLNIRSLQQTLRGALESVVGENVKLSEYVQRVMDRQTAAGAGERPIRIADMAAELKRRSQDAVKPATALADTAELLETPETLLRAPAARATPIWASEALRPGRATLEPPTLIDQVRKVADYLAQRVEGEVRVRPGELQAELRLYPPDLGRVRVELRLNADNNVETIFRVERVETAQLLRQNAQHFAEALGRHGLIVEKVDVQIIARASGEGLPGEGSDAEERDRDGESLDRKRARPEPGESDPQDFSDADWEELLETLNA